MQSATMVNTVSHIVEVDPRHGNDRLASQGSAAFRTLTAALANLGDDRALVRLAPGTYSAASGEIFPIVLSAAVILQGHESSHGSDTVIAGGGSNPTTDETAPVALVLTSHTQVRGITIQNPAGIGILVIAGAPLVRACRIQQCAHQAIKVRGQASPTLIDLHIRDITGHGISFTQQSRGTVETVTVGRCQYGISVTHAAAPLLQNNHCGDNQVGVVVAGMASPVLRQNRLIDNQVFGLWVQGKSLPDLGHPDDEAGNLVRHNRQADIRNDNPQALLAVGNDLLPQRLLGQVHLAASHVPATVAVPAPLIAQTAPVAQEVTSPATDPTWPKPGNSQPMGSSGQVKPATRFADLSEHWAAPYVTALADRGRLKGYPDGTFRPNAVINRAQFAALVASSYNSVPMTRPVVQFVDVSPQFWGYNAIALAQQQGFLSGYPDQTFRPQQPMTRVQAIAAVASGLKLAPAPVSHLGIYRDRAQIPSYAITALATAHYHNLVINHPDSALLRPLEPITRGEVATLIYQGLVATGQAPALGTDFTKPESIPAYAFADIQHHWAAGYIEKLLQRGIVQGYQDGHFYPNRPITRAQVAALLVKAFNLSPQRPARQFQDVPADHWAAQAIQIVYRAGFLSGFPDQTFAPDNGLLRVDAWVALVNGLGLLADHPADPAWLAPFHDAHQLPAYAEDAVARAAHLGLIVNEPTEADHLHPYRVATRADICASVYQALQLEAAIYR
jgi:hypothetical protein